MAAERHQGGEVITVACLWVEGHIAFGPEYVTRLASMVARHLKRPHKFVCLTDRPEQLPGIVTIGARCPPGLKAWWAKLRLFDPALRFRGRVLYLDLDTLVVNSLDPIVDFPAPFAIAPHAGNFQPRGYEVVPLYNSSVMSFIGGAFPELYLDWSPVSGRRLWGDQDWIGEQLPQLAKMPLEWFPRVSELWGCRREVRDRRLSYARVVLMKKPKNHIAAELYPWVKEAWV